MKKLKWKPSKESDTLPAGETVLVLLFMTAIAIILKISGII